MTTTADNRFLNTETIREYTNHRFLKYDQMLNLPRFQKLCQSAKMLYTYMLDRLHLSEKNSSRFSDERGLFIFFSYEEIMEKLDCAKAKAAKIMSELENYGLIFRGQCSGSPRKKIYLPVIELSEEEKAQVQISESQTEETQQYQERLQVEIAKHYHWSEADVISTVKKIFAEFEKTYGVGFTPEMVNNGLCKGASEFENQTHTSSKNELSIESDLPEQDLPCFDHSSIEETKEKNTAQANYETCLDQAEQQIAEHENDEDPYKTFFEGIDDSVSESGKQLQQERQELAAVMAWAYATPRPTLKISGIDVSIKTIRQKLNCITAKHASEILHNLRNSRPHIRNRKSYLLTCLFHAADMPILPNPSNARLYESFVYNLN